VEVADPVEVAEAAAMEIMEMAKMAAAVEAATPVPRDPLVELVAVEQSAWTTLL
jgi:hypothetical protein